MAKKVKWVNHYNNKQKLLLVGEGDFSFSACLATAFGSATNTVATSLDSERSLLTKHCQSEKNLEILKRKGGVVLHGINVHNMNKHQILSQMKFDIIIFNFPHAGFFPNPLPETDIKLIKRHRKIVKGFFRSAKEMLNEEGELHVTHRDDHPYSQWNLKELAENLGLVLKEKAKFLKEDYPGYHNKRGSGRKCNKTFPLKDSAYTFKFSLDKNFINPNHIM
ncbi:DUF2431 domain-containing protein [Melia azedarach]|uniref:DUF2431 domain-containing protein n=1 Tax=Melia azedarach TaxID=155640 RepID=A0ACC1Z430_MELAZ|nr:DUF2431 domain-containing protein [Melia azedarach]